MNRIITLLGFSLCLMGCAGIAQRAALPGSDLSHDQVKMNESKDYVLIKGTLPDGISIAAQFTPAHSAADYRSGRHGVKGTVIFFYGNRMSIAASQRMVSDLTNKGYDVLVADYPGYGMSTGTATESNCYKLADWVYDYAITTLQVSPEHLYVVGLSLGASVATDLASRKRIHGLILVVPFSRTRDIAADDLPWYSSWPAMLSSKYVAFDNIIKAPKISAPVLLVSADKDQVTSHQRTQKLVAQFKNIEHREIASGHDGAWDRATTEIFSWLALH